MTRKRKPEKSRENIIARLYMALDQKMQEIESRLETAGEGTSAADSERDARTLTSLARLYEKLSELENTGQKQEAGPGDKNADSLREEIASRLERLLQGQAD